MKILLRILSVGVIVIAALFLIGYFATGVGLWQANTPVTSGLTDAFTVVDELLQKADPVLDKTTGILGDVAKIENEISNGQSQTVAGVKGQLTALRANAQEAEQTLTTVIPQVPAYIDFIWIIATLVLLWLMLAQVALVYLAIRVLRTGRLRASTPVQATAPATTSEGPSA
jgi:hypothetical protein